MSGTFEVLYFGRRWHVGQQSTGYVRSYRLKASAVLAARALADYAGAELRIDNRRGRR
jgi:hypothetical protein